MLDSRTSEKIFVREYRQQPLADCIPGVNTPSLSKEEQDCANKYQGKPMFITGEHGRLSWEKIH